MKKKTDDIFKSNLGQFSQKPGPEMWTRIEEALDKQDTRRVIIPIWYRYAGVAAVALLLVTLTFNQAISNSITVAIAPVTPAQTQDEARKTESSDRSGTTSIASESKEQEGGPTRSESPTIQNPKKSPQATTQRALASQGASPLSPTHDKDPLSHAEQHVDQVMARNITGSVEAIALEKDAVSKLESISEAIADAPADAIALVPVSISEPKTSEIQTTTPFDTQETTSVALVEASLTLDPESPGMDEVSPGASRGLIVAPMAGPVYYSSLSGGSSIDPFLNDNPQNGDVSFSYGVQVALKWNEKLTLRTGIHNINVGYATQGIEIATGPASFGLSAVNYNSNNMVISVFDKGTFPPGPINDPTNAFGQLSLKSSSGTPELRASISYFEIPLEAQYQLIEGKISLSLISGLSGLFLNNSEVSVSDNENRYVLGELNNLSAFSVSTNLGFGIDYKVFSGFFLKVEPTFKYQIGAYSDSSIDFSPYQLGVMSGLRFKF